MTAQDVIDDVRRHLADSAETRWTDATLLVYLSNAQYEVQALRPDLLLIDGDTLATVVALTAVGDTLPFGSDVRGPLGYLTASIALGEDSDDRANAERSEKYRDRAIKELWQGTKG